MQEHRRSNDVRQVGVEACQALSEDDVPAVGFVSGLAESAPDAMEDARDLEGLHPPRFVAMEAPCPLEQLGSDTADREATRVVVPVAVAEGLNGSWASAKPTRSRRETFRGRRNRHTATPVKRSRPVADDPSTEQTSQP